MNPETITDGYAIVPALPALNETNVPLPLKLRRRVFQTLWAKCNSNVCGWRDRCQPTFETDTEGHVWIYPGNNSPEHHCIPESCALTNNVILVDPKTKAICLAF